MLRLLFQGGGSGYSSGTGTGSSYTASKSTYPSSTNLSNIGSSVSSSVIVVNRNEKKNEYTVQ